MQLFMKITDLGLGYYSLKRPEDVNSLLRNNIVGEKKINYDKKTPYQPQIPKAARGPRGGDEKFGGAGGGRLGPAATPVQPLRPPPPAPRGPCPPGLPLPQPPQAAAPSRPTLTCWPGSAGSAA